MSRLQALGRNWPSLAYFVALVALLAVPLVVVATVVVGRQSADVALTERKAIGVTFKASLRAAIRDLHTLRAGVIAHGTASLADRLAVERALTRLYDYNTGAGRIFYLTKALERLDNAWRATPERAGALPQIDLTLQRASEVSDALDQRSSLRTETSQPAADLVDACTVQLKIVGDRVDSARNLVVATDRSHRGSGSPEALAILSAQAEEAYRVARADVNRASAASDAVVPARAAVERAGDALASFEAAVAERPGPKSRESLVRRADRLFKAVDAASSLVAAQALQIFVERLHVQRRVLFWLLWGTFVASLGTLALGFFLVRTLQESNRREVRRVREEAAQLKTLRENDRMRELLALTEARFEAVFDRASIGVGILDCEGKLVRKNATLDRMLPEARPADLGAIHPEFARLVAGGVDAFTFDIDRRAEPEFRTAYEVVVSLVRDDSSAPLFAVVLLKDVTEQRSSDERLRFEATHDELVQLPNRSYLVDRMQALVGEERPTGFPGVAFVDMDDFKSINDTLGHEVGDRVLIAAARRLRTAVDAGDFVARFGGDEFVVLLKARDERDETVTAIDRIVRTLSAPYQIDGREIFVTISAGLAVVDRPYRAVDDLLRDADTAMYHAKAAGRARYAIFDPSMRDRAMRRRSLANQLRRALEREQFYLVFQPVVSLKTEEVQSLEVLLRWEHPELGLVPPIEFVPVLEEIGLIVPVGRWVLERACSQLARWRAEYSTFDATYLSVNASVREVMQTDYCEFVERTLERHGLRAHDLVLEVTETVLLQSDRYADRTLESLKRIGVGLAIDDFGTGYSSLRYLHQFPFDHLKIDASFVRGADGALASEPIVAMLIALGKAFRVNVVAEGVETREQARRLRALGCSGAQGFFFGGAAAPSVIPAIMARLPSEIAL